MASYIATLLLELVFVHQVGGDAVQISLWLTNEVVVRELQEAQVNVLRQVAGILGTVQMASQKAMQRCAVLLQARLGGRTDPHRPFYAVILWCHLGPWRGL